MSIDQKCDLKKSFKTFLVNYLICHLSYQIKKIRSELYNKCRTTYDFRKLEYSFNVSYANNLHVRFSQYKGYIDTGIETFKARSYHRIDARVCA